MHNYAIGSNTCIITHMNRANYFSASPDIYVIPNDRSTFHGIPNGNLVINSAGFSNNCIM